ncbi:MAG: hypothetical protein KDA41_01330, partial [Planctomycetales bacterium]|nr:hypothetical protein [Planctomycetales bacterium]
RLAEQQRRHMPCPFPASAAPPSYHIPTGFAGSDIFRQPDNDAGLVELLEGKPLSSSGAPHI